MPDRVIAIYRLRWRIELAFKRPQSGLGIHRLVARNPVMARNWLLAHLILALMIEDAAGEVLDSRPCTLCRPGPPCFTTAFPRRGAISVSRRHPADHRDRAYSIDRIRSMAPFPQPAPTPT